MKQVSTMRPYLALGLASWLGLAACAHNQEQELAGNEPSEGRTQVAETTSPEDSSAQATRVGERELQLKPQEREADVVFVPTPQAVVDLMLELAQVTKDDVVYDLGSGDGRIPITAAKKYGASAIGFEINPELVLEATENAHAAGVDDKVRFYQQDLFKTDLSEASVVTLYLLPSLNLELRPKLFKELKPGSRVVSHSFDMGSWQPDRVEQVNGRTVFFWTIPESVPENLL